jgi:hypothetical protein
LGLKLRSPCDRTSCIEYDLSTSGLGCAGVNINKRLVPIPRQISIAIALKTFLSVEFETNPKISSLLQIAYQVKNGFSMRFPWVRRVLGNLMSCIHDVASGGLSEIVELANNRTMVEVKIERWCILEGKETLAGTGFTLASVKFTSAIIASMSALWVNS